MLFLNPSLKQFVKSIRNRVRSMINVVPSRLRDSGQRRDINPVSSAERAIKWLRTCEHPNGGMRVHRDHPDASPRVSGYLVPTLLQYGEKDLAIRCLHWLIRIQREDG